MELLTLSVSLLLLATSIQSEKFDYFWRDYFGEVPDDALPGGFDQNRREIYIGQVHITNHGIFPTTIHDGQKAVTTSRNGIHTSDVFIKILCSNEPQKLLWVSTTFTKINETVAGEGRYLVQGGAEDGRELYIGRVSYQGQDIIGKVSVNNNTGILYFPYGGEEIASNSYQVLIYAKIY